MRAILFKLIQHILCQPTSSACFHFQETLGAKKVLLVNLAIREQGLKTKMLLTVHDEIVFDMYIPEQDVVRPLIEEQMKNAMPMKVPIVVEMGQGENWLVAH